MSNLSIQHLYFFTITYDSNAFLESKFIKHSRNLCLNTFEIILHSKDLVNHLFFSIHSKITLHKFEDKIQYYKHKLIFDIHDIV